MVIQAKSIVGSVKGLRYQSDDKTMAIEISRNGLLTDTPKEWSKEMSDVERRNERTSNKRFSVVIAPSKEISQNLSIDDWKNLVDEYLDKMAIDKNNHQYISHLHTSTDDPHLHLTISRIPMRDESKKHLAIPDIQIGIKSGTVADKIAKENGWRTAKEIGIEKRELTSVALRSVLKSARSYAELSSQMLKLGYVVKLSENDAKGIYGMRIISQSDSNEKPSKNAINNSLGYKLSELQRSPERKATFRINDINMALERNNYNSMSRPEQISFLNNKSEQVFNTKQTDIDTAQNNYQSSSSMVDELLKTTYVTKQDDDLLKKKRKKRK